jgi:SAM-dependent methyltransferase
MDKALVKDIIQWDVDTWSNIISFWEKEVDFSKKGNALELGGHQGGLSLWLALKGFNIVCSDLINVEQTAQPLHQKHMVSHLIHYQDIDATNIPFENQFDIIVFKSILGGIGRQNNIGAQQKTFDEIYKALKPGGVLLFAENLSASRFHRGLRKSFVNWGDSWRYVSIHEMETFLNEFKDVDYRTTGFLATFGRTEKQRSFLAKLDKLIMNPILPKKWKYMMYGVAKK